METSPLGAQPATAGARTIAPKDQSPTGLSADFTTFLNLLTAQLRNQDPMNPTNSTQFVAQLAQFSAVEQQVQSNDTLKDIFAAISGGGAEALTPWIGAQVKAAAPMPFDGETPVSLTVEPHGDATAAKLVVRDEGGAIVRQLVIDPKESKLEWDGKLANGDMAPAGNYSFQVDRVKDGDPLDSATPSGFTRVTEARLGKDGVELVLASGAVIPASDVTAIREGVSAG